MWDFKRWTFATLTELPFCPSRLKVPLLMVDGWTLGFTNFLCCSLWSSFSVSPLSLHSTNGSLFSAGWRLVLRLSSGCSEGAAVAVVITRIGKCAERRRLLVLYSVSFGSSAPHGFYAGFIWILHLSSSLFVPSGFWLMSPLPCIFVNTLHNKCQQRQGASKLFSH